MDLLPGYRIHETLHASARTLIYRARREEDDLAVVLKTFQPGVPVAEAQGRARHEYRLLRSLSGAGVIAVHSFDSQQEMPWLVLEDFGGEFLNRLLRSRTFRLPERLRIAIETSRILGEIHAGHTIHKAINPSHIVVNPATGALKLIGFGQAVIFSPEQPALPSPKVLDGDLAYFSPEQTGRMNRLLDYRSDFYSLGVTLYELFGHALPFADTDPLDLVHGHIAKTPLPLSRLNPDIPQPLAEIVTKLLAKNAEDRYQSAWGIQTDLMQCLPVANKAGAISTTTDNHTFTLARYDVPSCFHLPQKLYGRENEVNTLLATFARVATGQKEMLLVSGYSGIGKTVLIREIHKPVTQRRGYFIGGKFDALQPKPYAAFLTAFRELIRQLLSESDARLAQWRNQLIAALGSSAQAIIDLIPEMEWIVGPQPAMPELNPAEAENRFYWIVRNFSRVFCQPEHPLVVFLDDLQWADAGSLKLLESLMTDRTIAHLFLIGAYRDHEVSTGHPLLVTLQILQQQSIVPHQIKLAPLDFESTRQLLNDTLHRDQETIAPLVALVAHKTAGNPFFIKAFLKSLHREQQLLFDTRQGVWQWNMERIQAQPSTDNVIELLADRIQRLPESMRESLKLAACLGSRFDLNTLTWISGTAVQDMAAILREAVIQGLLEAIDNAPLPLVADTLQPENKTAAEFKFVHDRIQQAAYSLILDREKPAAHWRMGQLLLRHVPAEQREDRIFIIVNQLNAGVALANTSAERWQVAELNLLASKKAKTAAAWKSAFDYLKTGIGLLQEGDWVERYPLALALYEETAEAAYLNKNFELMEQLADSVSRHAQTVLDQVKVYEVRIQAAMARNDPLKAIAIGLEILKPLDMRFPEKPNQWHTLIAFLRTRWAWAGKRIEDLLDLPEMTNPSSLAAIRVFARILTASFAAAPGLMPLLIMAMTRLSLTHGNAPQSAFCYTAYGLPLTEISHDIEASYQFSQLALRLLERFPTQQALPTRVILISYGQNLVWKDDFKDNMPPLWRGYRIGLETGDFEFAAYCARAYFLNAFWGGKELNNLEQEMADYRDPIAPLAETLSLNAHFLPWQAVQNLLDRSEDPYRLIGAAFDERPLLQSRGQAKFGRTLLTFYVLKLQLCFLFEHYPQARENAAAMQALMQSYSGALGQPFYCLYAALAQLEACSEASGFQRWQLLRDVTRHQRKLKKWARHGPANCSHKYYLVEAERQRVFGREAPAMKLYDQAIVLAGEHGYIQEEALANELAARFYGASGNARIAKVYMREARACYARWGALAKVRQLEQRYPQWLAETAGAVPTRQAVPANVAPIPALASTNLDCAVILKASQALSGEIALDRLLDRLLRLALANAGADKAVLLLQENDRWLIEAQASVNVAQESVEQSAVVLTPSPFDNRDDLAATVIHYVARTHESVVLGDAASQEIFTQDAYLRTHAPKSLLCIPLLRQGHRLLGLLYLENTQVAGAFTPARVEVLQLLAAQAAISLENARLYASLERSEANFRSMYENAVEGVFQCTLDGRLLSANPALVKLLGYESPQHLLAAIPNIFQLCLTDRALTRTIRQQLQTEGRIIGLEIPWWQCCQGGGRFWISLSMWRVDATQNNARPWQPDDGTRYDGLVIDITVRKEKEQAERERETAKAAREKAEAASQAKSEFLATLSHEIRNPLNGILGVTRLLQRGRLAPPQAERVNAIYYASEALLTILNDVLDYSQIEAGKQPIESVNFSVRGLIDSVLLLLSSRAADKGLTLSAYIAPAVPATLKGNSRCLRQVLINLLGNAIKFTEQGRITLTVEMAGEDQLQCSVRDTGIGIAEDAREKLFQRFAQADASIASRFGGTGLGLAICKQLVEGSGGQIGFDSVVGEGSAFWFTLPVAEGSAATAIPAKSTVPLLPPLRILLVEDDDLNRQVARELLERDGHRVIACSSGREALNLLAEDTATEPPFDAVLMDIHMPDLDGLETTRQLRRLPNPALAALPIIALTAGVTANDIQHCLVAGMDVVLAKPIDLEALHQVLASYRQREPEAADSAQLLDLALLRQHRDALSRDRLEALLRQLHDNSASLTDTILDAWRRGEWSALAERAHRLSGVAANFGLRALGQRARAIERAAEQSQPDELARLIPDLAALHARSLEALTAQTRVGG